MSVRLYLTDPRTQVPQVLLRPDGSPLELHRARLFGHLLIASSTRIRECLVDTGAILSIFPERVWKEFEQEIEWLTVPAGTQPVEWCRAIQGLTGGTIACRLGAVAIRVIDFDLNVSSPTSIIAKFAEDGASGSNRLPRIILGLGGDAFRNRSLYLEPDTLTAYLTEQD